MLALPPSPLDLEVVHFDLAQYRVRRVASSTDDDEEDPQSDSPAPVSPACSSAMRTSSWKRKRTLSTDWSSKPVDICNHAPSQQLDQRDQAAKNFLERERLIQEHAVRTAELEETRRKLEEAERKLAQMECGPQQPLSRPVSSNQLSKTLALSHESATAPQTLAVECSAICLDASECSLCLDQIRMSAVGSCMCHFCHPCLTTAIANGLKACPKCKTPIHDVRRDPEFDALLAPPAVQMPEQEEAPSPSTDKVAASRSVPQVVRRQSFARRAAAKLGLMPPA